MPLKILIIGAGIGGLVAGVSLRKAGHNVTILEKRREKSECGYAMEISSNASRILKALGLDLPKVRGCRKTGMDIYNAEGSRLKWKMSEERPSHDDAPCISVHRQDYYLALKDLALGKDGTGPSAELRLGCEVTSYDVQSGSVSLESGEVLKADLLVAADGNSSVAHKYIIGEVRLPQFTGYSNVRFTLPTDQVLQFAGMEPIIQRGKEGRASVFLDSNGNMLTNYPCRDGTLQNFGVYHWDPTKSRDWKTQSVKAVAQERVRNMNSTLRSVIDLAKEKDMYLWQIVDRDPLPHMYKSRLVLIGDANHPMRSTLGQGASQAVEDAAVLGILLRQIESKSELSARLQIWEDLRSPRAGAIQLMSRTSATDVGWIIPEDKLQAQEFFPKGGLPLTRAEMTAYAHRYDALAEAKSALAALSRNKEPVVTVRELMLPVKSEGYA